MTSPAVFAYRKANKPPEFVTVPFVGSKAPFPVIHWTILRREFFWSPEAENWMVASEVVYSQQPLSETEARAEAALLNARNP